MSLYIVTAKWKIDKKMKIAMIRANMVEDRKNIIVMFLNELNRDIINVIEL